MPFTVSESKRGGGVVKLNYGGLKEKHVVSKLKVRGGDEASSYELSGMRR